MRCDNLIVEGTSKKTFRPGKKAPTPHEKASGSRLSQRLTAGKIFKHSTKRNLFCAIFKIHDLEWITYSEFFPHFLAHFFERDGGILPLLR